MIQHQARKQTEKEGRLWEVIVIIYDGSILSLSIYNTFKSLQDHSDKKLEEKSSAAHCAAELLPCLLPINIDLEVFHYLTFPFLL